MLFRSSNVREIYSIEIQENKNLIEIYIDGNGFLYNMVRIISGALVDVGLRKKTPEDIKAMLEVKNRAEASDTAPSKGLFLYKVKY